MKCNKIKTACHLGRRFLSLPAPLQGVLVHTLAAVLIIRSALSLFSLRHVVTALRYFSRRKTNRKRFDQEDILYASAAISRRLPCITCLVSGLAGQYLLSRNGYPSTLHIGVKKETGKVLMAHAWVTIDQRVVIGMIDDLHTYTPLSERG